MISRKQFKALCAESAQFFAGCPDEAEQEEFMLKILERAGCDGVEGIFGPIQKGSEIELIRHIDNLPVHTRMIVTSSLVDPKTEPFFARPKGKKALYTIYRAEAKIIKRAK